jgi:hypothetical protein
VVHFEVGAVDGDFFSEVGQEVLDFLHEQGVALSDELMLFGNLSEEFANLLAQLIGLILLIKSQALALDLRVNVSQDFFVFQQPCVQLDWLRANIACFVQRLLDPFLFWRDLLNCIDLLGGSSFSSGSLLEQRWCLLLGLFERHPIKWSELIILTCNVNSILVTT